ncbi:MAG TPA: PEGA domain-containing protein, partial [Planctomycetes bacterium]|nr:PEGA domain-containing protein [Planctomycetota bacterium]
PVRISVDQGTHRLELRRRGYEWIEQTIEVGRGQRVVVKLNWILETFPEGGLSPVDPHPAETTAPE